MTDRTADAADAAETGPASPPETPSPPTAGEERQTIQRSMLALALLSIGIFLQSVTYGLIYDDHFLIRTNASVDAVKEDITAVFDLFGMEYWEGVNAEGPELTKVHGQGLYRPISLVAWSLIAAASDATWPFHLLNILLHAAVVVMLYRTLRTLFSSQTLAFVSAVIYALHPLHSEAVANVAGLHDVLSTLAVVLGLYLFTAGRNAKGELTSSAWLGMLVTLFLGLMAKEQTVLLLPIVAVTDFMWSRQGRSVPGRQRLLLYGGMILAVGLHVLIRWKALGYLGAQPGAVSFVDNPLVSEPFNIRLINGLHLMAMRVWLFLWPAQLSGDYSFNAIKLQRTFTAPEAIAGAALVLMMVVFGLAWLRRWPALAWGILIWIGCAAFTSNIAVPIGTILAERLTYLPTIGAAVAVGAVIDRFIVSRSKGGVLSPVALLIMVGLSAALAMRTIDRNNDFASTYDLFTSAMKVVPESARVHYQLGNLAFEDELYTASEEHLLIATQIAPTFVIAQVKLGDLYAKDKNFEKAISTYEGLLYQLSAVDTHKTIIEQTRQMVTFRLADVRSRKGDLTGAEEEMKRLISIRPNDVVGYVAMAELLMDAGRAPDALTYLRKAIALKPDAERALYIMCQAAVIANDREAYDLAVAGLEKTEGGAPFAIALQAEALYERGYRQGDDEMKQQALQQFEEALELKPDLATAHLYRGRYLAERNRHFDALYEFDKALEIQDRNLGALTFKVLSQLELNDMEGAQATAAALESVRPDANCYTILAEIYYRQGKLDRMAEALERLEEVGQDPVELLVSKVRAYEAQDRRDDAIGILQESLKLEKYEGDPILLRWLGIMLLRADRPDEALAAFELQEQALAADPEATDDIYLPVNRAKALMALDRDVEAAEQLEQFAASISKDDPAWVSLLRWRAVLFLRTDGPFYDPERAEELCVEGLFRTERSSPDMFDGSIEARVAMGNVPGALERTREALAPFPDFEHYQVAEQALTVAAAGQTSEAVAMLRENGNPLLLRIADKLEAP